MEYIKAGLIGFVIVFPWTVAALLLGTRFRIKTFFCYSCWYRFASILERKRCTACGAESVEKIY